MAHRGKPKVRGRRRWSTNSVTIVDYRGMSVSKVKLTFRSVVNNPLLSFVRNKLFFKLKRNIVGQLLFVMLYINLAALENDPPMAMSNTENLMMIFPFNFLRLF